MFIGASVVCGVIVANSWHPDTGMPMTIADQIEVALVSVVVAGLLPGLTVRSMIRRDVKPLARLVRNGAACRGRITKHDRIPHGGMHKLTVSWQEAERDASASFDIEKLEQNVSKTDVLVLAKRDTSWVAVLIEDGLFLGRRTD